MWMSELIPFPKMKEKLCLDIKRAVDDAQYEKAYDAFMTYEKHFELTNELALVKCHVLWELEAYLELREETHILVKQEFEPQDDLMLFHVKSLYALKQYQSVVGIVDQLFKNDVSHEMRMALLPLSDQAKRKLHERQEAMQVQLQQFDQLSVPQQTELILTLIEDGAYHFADTIAYLMTQDNIRTTLQSLMLEYLRFARYNQSIQLEMYGQQFEVIPAQLESFEATRFIDIIVPQIIELLEAEYPSLVQEAHVHLNAHNIAMYPIDITQIADDKTWVQSYFVYFEEMMGLPPTYSLDVTVLDFIKLLNS